MPEWAGFVEFPGFLYLGDSVFGDADIGKRPADCVAKCGEIDRNVLGK